MKNLKEWFLHLVMCSFISKYAKKNGVSFIDISVEFDKENREISVMYYGDREDVTHCLDVIKV